LSQALSSKLSASNFFPADTDDVPTAESFPLTAVRQWLYGPMTQWLNFAMK